jgi:DNA-binding NtrC family response regulator
VGFNLKTEGIGMKPLKSWFTRKRNEAAAPLQDTLVIATKDEALRKKLKDAAGPDWAVKFASCLEEVRRMCASQEPAAVLWDRELPTNWRTAVVDLADSAAHTPIILLSGDGTPLLWEEAVRLGGYDVVYRNATADQFAHVLRSAHSHFRSQRALDEITRGVSD